MLQRRGLALTEVLVATTILFVIFMCFLSVFQSSYQHNQQTRNRMVATILAHSLLEEVEAHPYGYAAPPTWGSDVQDRPARVWIEGRQVEMTFNKTFTYLNGSFVGKPGAKDDSDVVTITITWREAGLADQVATDDKKKLVVAVPVWR